MNKAEYTSSILPSHSPESVGNGSDIEVSSESIRLLIEGSNLRDIELFDENGNFNEAQVKKGVYLTYQDEDDVTVCIPLHISYTDFHHNKWRIEVNDIPKNGDKNEISVRFLGNNKIRFGTVDGSSQIGKYEGHGLYSLLLSKIFKNCNCIESDVINPETRNSVHYYAQEYGAQSSIPGHVLAVETPIAGARKGFISNVPIAGIELSSIRVLYLDHEIFWNLHHAYLLAVDYAKMKLRNDEKLLEKYDAKYLDSDSFGVDVYNFLTYSINEFEEKKEELLEVAIQSGIPASEAKDQLDKLSSYMDVLKENFYIDLSSMKTVVW